MIQNNNAGGFRAYQQILISVFFLGCLFIFSECRQKPPYQADISGIEIEPVRIKAYDKVLFNLNPHALREEIDPYIDTFYFFLGEEIDNPMAQQQLFDYITDPLIRELYEDAREIWTPVRIQQLEATLNNAFRYHKYHFPDDPIPEVFSYISGLDFREPVKYAEHHLVIGLDMYLGPDYQKYHQFGLPVYQTLRRHPDFVPGDVVRLMGENHMQENPSVPDNFLDYMIYEGKLLYFADCMLPGIHDTLKIGYTTQQQLWMEQNRSFVWTYYIDNEFLYSSDRQLINRFVGDAPFTSVFSRDSAPRTAAWIGWQIVREYMRRHPEIGLGELLLMTDASHILHESSYRAR